MSRFCSKIAKPGKRPLRCKRGAMLEAVYSSLRANGGSELDEARADYARHVNACTQERARWNREQGAKRAMVHRLEPKHEKREPTSHERFLAKAVAAEAALRAWQTKAKRAETFIRKYTRRAKLYRTKAGKA